MRSWHISKRSSRISTRSHLISLSSGRISTDQTENTDKPLLSMVNGDFLVSIRAGQLKIDFLASNLPTNLPFLGSGGRDLPPTVIGVRSTGSQAGSDGFGGWVGSWFCLDTPIQYLASHFSFSFFSFFFLFFSAFNFSHLGKHCNFVAHSLA